MHLPERIDPGAVVVAEIVRANKHSLEGRLASVKHAAPAPVVPTLRKVLLPVVHA